MGLFRLLHASDLHIGQFANQLAFFDAPSWMRVMHPRYFHRQSTHRSGALDAFLDIAEFNAHEIDAILITGDIACRGSSADLQAASRHLCQTKPHPAAPAPLTTCIAPLCILPGNHDRFTVRPNHWLHFPFYGPGSSQFDTEFAEFWRGGQGCQILFCGENADGSVLGIVGADLTLRKWDFGRGVLGWFGQGRVRNEHLGESQVAGSVKDQRDTETLSGQHANSLVHLTRQIRVRHPHAAVIWAIHFEPSTERNALRLLDETKLHKAAKANDIDAILCGHTHEGRDHLWRCTHIPEQSAPSVRVMTCGTTTRYHVGPDIRNEFNHVRIDVDPLRRRQTQFAVKTFQYDGIRFNRASPR